jgi:hypothetical protein
MRTDGEYIRGWVRTIGWGNFSEVGLICRAIVVICDVQRDFERDGERGELFERVKRGCERIDECLEQLRGHIEQLKRDCEQL